MSRSWIIRNVMVETFSRNTYRQYDIKGSFEDNFCRTVKVLHNFLTLLLGLQIYAEVFEDNGGVCGRWMSSKVKRNNLGGFDMLGRKGYI